MDIDRLGIFSNPSSIHIGDPYTKKPDLPSREKGKQFTIVPPLKGCLPDVFLEKELKRNSEGDPYKDDWDREKEARHKSRGAFPVTKPFKPSSPPKRSTGPGTGEGCFTPTWEHVGEPPLSHGRALSSKNENDGDVESPKADPSATAHLRNFLTAPPRRGGPGTTGNTIGAYPEYIPETFEWARKNDRELRKEARARIPKPFISTICRRPVFDSHVHEGQPSPLYKPEKREPPLAKPFRPSSPGKKGFNCTFTPFSYDSKGGTNYVSFMRNDKGQKVFRPASGPKCYPVRTVNPYQSHPKAPQPHNIMCIPPQRITPHPLSPHPTD